MRKEILNIMGRLVSSHKERVEKVRDFTDKNKIFTIIAVIVMIVLLFNFIFSKINSDEVQKVDNSQITEKTEEVPVEEQWEFYWIDLWILLGAGGFCTVMIIKEKKKARENI